MTLYNIVAKELLEQEMKPHNFYKAGDVPSCIQFSSLPFSRIYLVSRNKETAQHWAGELNKAFHKNLEVQELSGLGKFWFYVRRYGLGKISFVLGESLDLDDGKNKIFANIAWSHGKICDYSSDISDFFLKEGSFSFVADVKK